MTQNQRQAVLILTVAAVMLGIPVWMIPASKEPSVWWFRIGAILVVGLNAGYVIWVKRRKDLAPDFLSDIATPFFEQQGFSFVVDTDVVDGVCHLCVWFHNRYERVCEATVMLRTSERLLAPQRHLPDVKAVVQCEAGAFGKALVPWPLPAQLQGRKVLVDVMATRKYRKGRGKMLRYKVGLEVGRAPVTAVSDILSVIGVLGGIHDRRAARTEIELPEDVAVEVPQGVGERCETLWKLGDAVEMVKWCDKMVAAGHRHS